MHLDLSLVHMVVSWIKNSVGSFLGSPSVRGIRLFFIAMIFLIGVKEVQAQSKPIVYFNELYRGTGTGYSTSN